MRSTLTLALLASTCSISAQLQNGGFEALSSLNMPSFWTTGIELIVIGDSVVVDSAKYLLNTTDVHSGQHAAELRNSYNYTQDFGTPGQWFASPFEEGYGGFPSPDVPVTERPERLRFWAKYAPVEGDAGYAEVAVLSGDFQQIGFGSLQINGDVSAYTAFEVPVTYTSTETAAYVQVRFVTMVPGGNPHLGTRMLIDDVSIDYVATGITEANTTALGLFPNPATDDVRLTGLNLGPSTTVRVLEATGRVVLNSTLINGRLPLKGLLPGAYLVQADQAGVLYQSRLVIAR